MKIKTTASLLKLAAVLLERSSVANKGKRHIEINDAILDATKEGGYRREVMQRAMTAIKLFTHDKNGSPVSLGKAFTESGQAYAIQSVVKNAEKKVAALKSAAELCENGKNVGKGVRTATVNETAAKLEKTEKALRETRAKVQEERVARGEVEKSLKKAVKKAVHPAVKKAIASTKVASKKVPAKKVVPAAAKRSKDSAKNGI